jgi:hypothetical protein
MSKKDKKELYYIILSVVLGILSLVLSYAFYVDRKILSKILLVGVIGAIIILYLCYWFYHDFRKIALVVSFGEIALGLLLAWKARWILTSFEQYSKLYTWTLMAILGILILQSLLLMLHLKIRDNISITIGFTLSLAAVVVALLAFMVFPRYADILSCNSLSDQVSKDDCWTNKAFNSGESEFCMNISEETHSNLCLALITKDKNYCIKGGQSKDDVDYCLALLSKDNKSCESLPQQYKDSCFAYIEYS